MKKFLTSWWGMLVSLWLTAFVLAIVYALPFNTAWASWASLGFFIAGVLWGFGGLVYSLIWTLRNSKK